MSHLFWLAWQAATNDGKTVAEFKAWMRGLGDVTITDSETPAPLAVVPLPG